MVLAAIITKYYRYYPCKDRDGCYKYTIGYYKTLF